MYLCKETALLLSQSFVETAKANKNKSQILTI